jgi:Flp pilus assembly protein TadB
MVPQTDVSNIIKKYSSKLSSDLKSQNQGYSSDYKTFKEEMIPQLSNYEKWAKSLGNVLSIKVAENDRKKIQKFLDIAHLEATASQALTLSIVSLFTIFLLSLLICASIYLINPEINLPNLALLGFLGLITSLFAFYYTYSMPQRLANSWRLKASSQMVPAILYVVVYMKHTSNLERAIEFASQHLEGPLALDFKKIFYNVQIGKFSTIKASLDDYFESWRDYAPEFVESFHLIESSLFEPSESRRVQILEKSLQVILDGVYEKMLKYSREIRSPLTNIYMLGIVLPTLALALLPLASALLQGYIKWPHVFLIFNIIIPFFVFFLTSEVLLKRPGGYGETSVLELNPKYQEFKSNKPYIKSALISIPLLIIGLIPFLFQSTSFTSLFGFKSDYSFAELGLSFLGDTKIFHFICSSGSLPPCPSGNSLLGPFGPLAVILSLFIPLSIALFFALAYKEKTNNIIKARQNTQILEEEFADTLFILGNRLGEGIPAEIAFSRVAETTQGQKTSEFFAITNRNMQEVGMSLESSIFDKRRGSLSYYPSSLISTSMKILVEAVKKGLQVAARSLMSISDYVKNIQKINQRLRDLLAEVVSDMRSNMTFLAPLLAGIVIGLSTMITIILSKLQSIQNLAGSQDTGLTFTSFLSVFDLTKMIPPYFLQIVVGIYIIEIIFILTSALVTVDSGRDPLKEKSDLSKYLKSGISLYILTALISVVVLAILAYVSLSGLG